VAVLAYLAVRFFRSGVSNEAIAKPLSFKEGVFIELLNAKYLLIPVVMFSQFYSPSEDGVMGLITLTISLPALTMTSNYIWVVGGSFLTSVLAREWVAKYQGFIFGGVLLATAIWLGIG
jgi:threonine/homoserine/homoserine lactone efflux protein